MPELPEVETVRDGLDRHLLGRTIIGVEVRRASAVRRHDGGPDDFAAWLTGRTARAAVRRGKYLWLLIDDSALVAHLGMSGQLLVRARGDEGAEAPHLRVRLRLDDGGRLDFVDQRTFGHLAVRPLVPTSDGAPGGHGAADAVVPDLVAHIARDLLDPHGDRAALVTAVRHRRTGIKRALLDQGLVSGIGNIYADEALWRARLHYARPTETLRRPRVVQTRPPECLVRVDVPDPRDQALIEQRALDPGPTSSDRRDQGRPVAVRIEQVAGDVRHEVRYDGLGCAVPPRCSVRGRDERPDGEVAEGALVHEVQATAVVEPEPDPQVRRLSALVAARSDQELSTHAEVCDQGRVVDEQPQILAPAHRSPRGAAGQPCCEIVRTSVVTPHRRGAAHLDPDDRASQQVAVQPVADGLDLR